MFRLMITLLSLATFVAGPVSAATAAKTEKAPEAVVKTVGNLSIVSTEVESDTANTAITVKLSKEASWGSLDVEDHGTFLQVRFPSTSVTQSGEFVDGKGPYVAKVAMFQVSEGEAAVRIFLKRDANLIKTATKVDVLGSRVVIFIDHSLLEKIGIAEHLAAKPTIAPQEAPPAEAVAAPIKAEDFAGMTGIPEKSKQKHEDLNEKLEVAAMFSGFMLVGLLVALGLRKFWRKRGGAAREELSPAIKTLANYALSPKQKLTLIQVGDEKILLAVNANTVSFLTNVGRPAYAAAPAAYAVPREAAGMLTRSAEAPALESFMEQRRPAAARAPAKATFSQKLAAEKEPASHLRLKEEAKAAPAARTASRIQVAIDDNGITDMNKTSTKRAAASAKPQQQSIEDVTAMIRRKLRDLPGKN